MFSPLNNRLRVNLSLSGKRICSKSEYGVHFSLLLGAAIALSCFKLRDSILMGRGSRALVLPALPRLCAVHRMAASFAALNKQTNMLDNPKEFIYFAIFHDIHPIH
jgi:hypothetical protein